MGLSTQATALKSHAKRNAQYEFYKPDRFALLEN
jgi:hypothetical protein